MSRQRMPATDAAVDRLTAALDRLAGLDAGTLEQRWRQLFGSPAPSGLSLALRARVIAYRLQARALGDLDRDTVQALDRLARGQAGQGRSDAGERRTLPVPDRRGQMPGALLTREWGGAMHTVTVLQAGYAWNEVVYDSLSAVAQAITGTKWNGPRFFGLRDRMDRSGRGSRAHVPSRAPQRPAV